jgi:uncharacterized RDD family membrane protein YckC
MLQRAVLVLAVMLVMTFALQGCWPGYYYSLQLQSVNGRPYIVVGHHSDNIDQDNGLFSIYTPKDKSWNQWDEVAPNRSGPAVGVFLVEPKNVPPDTTPKPEPDPTTVATKDERATPLPPSEQLGIFHPRRTTFLDVSARPVKQSLEVLPFSWIAETATSLNGVTYAFGAELQELDSNKKPFGPMRVAKFDGQKWEELRFEKPPAVHSGKSGFSLQSILCQGAIKVFWREAESDQALGAPDFEGYRIVTEGPLMMATFDGKEFVKEPVPIKDLPRGNTSVRAEGEDISILVQTRLKLEDALSKNGPIEIWKYSKDGALSLVETIEASRAKNGLLAYIVADRATWDGDEFVVRTNWQTFEVWQKNEKGWMRIVERPTGIPTYDLETPLIGMLAMGLTMIAFGAGLAFHRRKQALALVRKIQAHDIYATLGLRMGAYAVDLGLILVLARLVAHLQGVHNVSPLAMLDFSTLPYAPFYAIYLGYLAGSEWLFGASLGKYLMGLSVVMDSGQKLSLWAALVRNMFGFFERLPLFFIISAPMIIFGPRRQRLGDILSRTIVVQRGALEVFKAQRAQELELKKASESSDDQSANLLPPLNAGPFVSGADKEKASSDKDDKGRRS